MILGSPISADCPTVLRSSAFAEEDSLIIRGCEPVSCFAYINLSSSAKAEDLGPKGAARVGSGSPSERARLVSYFIMCTARSRQRQE